MKNIKLSHMSHWKTVPYKHIPNFRDFYYEDKTNIPYFLDWDKIIKYHAATGYDGIEVAPWDMAEITALFGSPEAFAEFTAERGVQVSGMFHGISGGHIKENLKQCFNEGKAAIDLLASMGGVHLNTCPGSNYYGEGPLTEEGIESTITCLNEIGRYAKDHGVKLGIHNEFFCIMNKDNHRRIIEATDPSCVHYCLDTAQIVIIGEDLLKFYEDYHDRICTFHLKDTADVALPDSVRYSQDVEIQDDGHRWFWEPGLGVLDFPGLWKLMRKHSFNGWITVETDGTPDLLASMALSSYYIKNDLSLIYQ